MTSLEMIKAYDGPQQDYEYDSELPQSILDGNEMVAKVHIVANGGSVLVVEKGDRVIPVFNDQPDRVRDLFRNDKIRLKYQVQVFPQRPVHLALDNSVESPVQVLESIADGHGETIELTGPLVMFPKSPQIKFNVFALRTQDSDQISRNFTIVNFSVIDLFFAIRDQLQSLWDQHVSTARIRSKQIHQS